MLVPVPEGRSPAYRAAAGAAQGTRSKRKTRELQCDSRELRISGGFHLFDKPSRTYKKLAAPGCPFSAAEGMPRVFFSPALALSCTRCNRGWLLRCPPGRAGRCGVKAADSRDCLGCGGRAHPRTGVGAWGQRAGAGGGCEGNGGRTGQGWEGSKRCRAEG